MKKYLTRQNVILAIVVIACFAIVPIAAKIQFNNYKERLAEQNRAMLAVASPQATPTCPGIADAAGNCMEQFAYNFTIEASPTPQPFCTPPVCINGELVCNLENGCPNGCGVSCQIDEPPTPPEPDVICLYWYSPLKQRCYPKETR